MPPLREVIVLRARCRVMVTPNEGNGPMPVGVIDVGQWFALMKIHGGPILARDAVPPAPTFHVARIGTSPDADPPP